ncbi:MAG: alkylation response protein AidB-like acyl-CoA dehydrogenase [Lysobacterales bacterium]|jgi:alkylation response protein AidB-like acyl-CoA dehydrogenase
MIYKAPVNDMMFLINNWIGISHINSLPGFEHIDSETFEFILEEAGKFCSNELLPINRQGDEIGAKFENGAVTTPPGFKNAYRQFSENGWIGMDADPEHGGQGLPRMIKFLIDEMLCACNLGFKLYTELTQGAYHLMNHAAPDHLKSICLPHMVDGSWSGTMCLTEPHCGTDLGLLTTRASLNEDDTYAINGTKIFITSGDHDLTDNILHMVLARIDGAPEGSRGISLFLVPKFNFDEKGTLGERNGVVTGSIEHKMGIKASATCVLNFDNAKAFLLGEVNHGLRAMFKMMNLERITVGIQGLGFAEIAYQNAVSYAMERSQSKAPPPRPDSSKASDLIILQPDIQRKLLTMRSQIEGGRALAVYAAYQTDVMEKATDTEQKQAAEDVVALLTPIVKSYLSDLGVSSTLEAQQVFGGHGYIREHGMEQLVRDSRIATIYEGTNEVQAADLVLRKLSANNGRIVEVFFADLKGMLSDQESQSEFVGPAMAALENLVQVTVWMQEKLLKDIAAVSGAATLYQRMFALTVVACLWADIIRTIDGKEGDFFETKRKLARFYMQNVLPEAESLGRAVTLGADSLADFDIRLFDV